MLSFCGGRGFGEPASEPVFSAVPAIILKRKLRGQAPRVKQNHSIYPQSHSQLKACNSGFMLFINHSFSTINTSCSKQFIFHIFNTSHAFSINTSYHIFGAIHVVHSQCHICFLVQCHAHLVHTWFHEVTQITSPLSFKMIISFITIILCSCFTEIRIYIMSCLAQVVR